MSTKSSGDNELNKYQKVEHPLLKLIGRFRGEWMRNLKVRITLILVGAVLTMAYSNCSRFGNPVDFAPPETSMASSEVPDEPLLSELPAPTSDGKDKVHDTVLKANSSSGKVDIVWVIDNSASMNEEAAHVRANFANFAQSVSNKSDMRIALISDRGEAGTKVTLPDLGSRGLQIDQTVGSTNALSITAQQLKSNPLKNFLRSSSKKVFVFVTDDETAMTRGDFLTEFQSRFPGQSPTVFAFVGLGGESPCQWKKGERYIDFALRSGGRSFNICDADWTQTFNVLAGDVVDLAWDPIRVESNMNRVEVKFITVNGQPISEDDYEVTYQGIVLNPSLLGSATEAAVRVIYSLR